MKRDEKFHLVNELSKAVTDKTVYEHLLQHNSGTEESKKMTDKQLSRENLAKQEQELFDKIYQQRKNGK